MSGTADRRTAWSYLADSLKPTGWVSFVIALLATVLFSTKYVQIEVPFALLASVFIVAVTVILALVQALRTAVAHGPHEPYLKVVKVVEASAPYKGSLCMCLVETAAALPVTTTVQFLIDRDCERQLGWGTVRHLQADGRLQITLDGAHDGMEDAVESLRKKDNDVVGSLRIRYQMSLGIAPVMPNAALPHPSAPTTAPLTPSPPNAVAALPPATAAFSNPGPTSGV